MMEFYNAFWLSLEKEKRQVVLNKSPNELPVNKRWVSRLIDNNTVYSHGSFSFTEHDPVDYKIWLLDAMSH
jgi:hypothetical protein